MNKGLVVAGVAGLAALVVGVAVASSSKGSSGGTPPPANKGTSVITKSPANAVVTLNGTIIAAGSSNLAAGNYNWQATADGYTSQSGTVTIVVGQTYNLNINLTQPGGGGNYNPKFSIGDVLFYGNSLFTVRAITFGANPMYTLTEGVYPYDSNPTDQPCQNIDTTMAYYEHVYIGS